MPKYVREWVAALALSYVCITLVQAHQQMLSDERSDDANLPMSTSGAPVYLENGFLNMPWYYTRVALGTGPPQELRVLIDIQSSTTWIISTDCNGHDDIRVPHNRYDHHKSPTYESNGTSTHLQTFFTSEMDGVVAFDTIAFGIETQLPLQPFHEVTHRSNHSIEPLFPWDAGLGLSLSSNGTHYNWCPPSSRIPTVVETLLDNVSPQNPVKPLFGLLLPKDDTSVGDFSFGHINPAAYVGDLVPHPLHPPDTKSWSIRGPVISIHAANGTLLLTCDLTDYTAYLDTIFEGYSLLPDPAADSVLLALGASTITCDSDLDSLPTITYTFDSRQNITLTGRDYVWEDGDLWGGRGTCKVPFSSAGPGDDDILFLGPKSMLLGTSAFLKEVYTVFDAGERTISCESCRFLRHPQFSPFHPRRSKLTVFRDDRSRKPPRLRMKYPSTFLGPKFAF
nr:vacuolar protease a [Quercus suber]